MEAALKAGKVPVFGSGVPVAFRLNIYRAANRGDIDNFCKVVSDAINGVIWNDDSQVRSIVAWMGTDKSEPRVEVLVEAA